MISLKKRLPSVAIIAVSQHKKSVAQRRFDDFCGWDIKGSKFLGMVFNRY
jgi:hypothetical protein